MHRGYGSGGCVLMLCEGLGQQGEVAWLEARRRIGWARGTAGWRVEGSYSSTAWQQNSLLLLQIQGLCVLALLP